MSPSRFNRAESNMQAEPDAPIGPHGETVLHLAAQEGKPAEAAKAIAAGATVFIMDRKNSTPLIYAAAIGATDVIRELVRADRKGIDYAGSTGTALGLAARRCDIESVRVLLDSGADINAPDDMGATPLMDAVFNKEKAMVDYLILRGVDVNVLRMGEGALHLAARTGDVGIIKSILAAGGAEQLNQQTRTNKLSPLHVAVLTGEHAAAEELLTAGAMTGLENAQGLTPVEMAAQQGDAKMIRLLVERGQADLRVAGGEQKFTPLLRAVFDGKEEAVRELVRMGADPEAKDSGGRNALALAAAKNNVELVKFFAEELADAPASLAAALKEAQDKNSSAVIPLLEQAGKDYVMRHNFPKSTTLSP